VPSKHLSYLTFPPPTYFPQWQTLQTRSATFLLYLTWTFRTLHYLFSLLSLNRQNFNVKRSHTNSASSTDVNTKTSTFSVSRVGAGDVLDTHKSLLKGLKVQILNYSPPPALGFFPNLWHQMEVGYSIMTNLWHHLDTLDSSTSLNAAAKTKTLATAIN
jgi:hypothetical protein